MPEPSLNPYSVTVVDESVDDLTDLNLGRSYESFSEEVVQGSRVIYSSIGWTILAGSTFGLGLVLIFWFGSLIMGGPTSDDSIYLLIGLPIACAVGGVLAAIASIPISLLLWSIRQGFNRRGQNWTAYQMRWMYWGTGSLSGFCSVAVPYEFDPEGFVIGLVAACVGGILVGFFGERAIRKARKAQQSLQKERSFPSTTQDFDDMNVLSQPPA